MRIRTEVGKCQQGKNGKWSTCFNTHMGEPGREILSNVVTSPPLWDNEDEAHYAGTRALDVLENSGSFPNLSMRW